MSHVSAAYLDDVRTGTILEVTLASDLRPGTNVKGDVGGANWTFLRPRLRSERCLCYGAPPLSTLKTLHLISTSVTVAVRTRRAARRVETLCRRADLTNVHAQLIGLHGSLALPEAGIDLIMVSGWRNRWRLRRNPRVQQELRRLLTADAVMYYECRAILAASSAHRMEGFPGFAIQRLWLTPPAGEMETAVPLDDASTAAYFRTHRLYSPAIDPAALVRRAKRIAACVRATLVRWRHPLSPAERRDRTRRASRPATTTLGRAVVRAVQKSDEWTSGVRQSFKAQLPGRCGVLLARSADLLPQGPPRYLRSLGETSGVPLEDFRWGLAARGRYNSRKVLFFLTRGRLDPPSATPLYIVKIVRTPRLNGRLENEHRALRALRDLGTADGETVPRPVFFGYHAGLAVLCETVVAGVPFRQRSSGRPECPWLRGAVESFRALALRTRHEARRRADITDALRTLLDRFSAVYHPPAAEHRFLATQIAALSAVDGSTPLVVLHGDAGPWNMLVTPGGRIALLDWEAAEISGLPLWDLLYFLRAYCIDASGARGPQDALAGFASHFMGDTSLGGFVAEAARRYCADVGVPPEAVEPLFYTCWMHRALKEATRLRPSVLGNGHYVNLLRFAMAHREAPTLQRLFAA